MTDEPATVPIGRDKYKIPTLPVFVLQRDESTALQLAPCRPQAALPLRPDCLPEGCAPCRALSLSPAEASNPKLVEPLRRDRSSLAQFIEPSPHNRIEQGHNPRHEVRARAPGWELTKMLSHIIGGATAEFQQ